MDTYRALDAFAAAMAAAGLAPLRDGTLVADGQLHRYAAEGDRPGKRNAWYVLYLDGRVPGGAFGSWRTGQHETWSAKAAHEFNAEERAEWQARQAALRAARERAMEETAVRAQRIWAGLPDSGPSPYLQRKQVRAFGLRFAKGGTVVVPVMDLDRKLWGLQFIAGDGTKRFLTGTAKKGRCHWLGPPSDVIAIAEGYATAASVHMATGWQSFVAFDAGNLLPVAQAVRARQPGADLVICGDNDLLTPGNPGRTAALAAARAAAARVVVPRPRLAAVT